MGSDDKSQGKVKEVAGKLTGDEELEGEGRSQRATEEGKQQAQEQVDKAKGAAEGVKDKLTGDS